MFNPLTSINYRLLIGQEVLVPIPLPYLQDTFKSARAMVHTTFFCPVTLTHDTYFSRHRPINAEIRAADGQLDQRILSVSYDKRDNGCV